jgi:hypothetical protein
VLDPILVLGAVHRAHAGRDAETLEVLDEGQHDALPRPVGEKDLERHRPPGRGLHEPGVAHDPARLFEQTQRPQQVGPQPAGLGGGRRVGRREDLGHHLIAKRGEAPQLPSARRTRRSAKTARRVLYTKPCMPVGSWCEISSCLMRPWRTAGTS